MLQIQFLRKASRNACSTRKAQSIIELVKGDGDTTRVLMAGQWSRTA